MVEAQYRISVFCPPRISPKENGWSKRRIPPQTPPPPLAKSESSRGFAETISPENCFRKTESVLYSCFRPFPFGKALCFAQRRFSATDARLVTLLFEQSSSKVYNYSTSYYFYPGEDLNLTDSVHLSYRLAIYSRFSSPLMRAKQFARSGHTLYVSLRSLCPGEDLNLHELPRLLLRQVRLPFRHLGNFCSAKIVSKDFRKR